MSRKSVVRALVLSILVLSPAVARAGWGIPYLAPPKVVRPAIPDQTWLKDVPEKPGAPSRGKVAVFVFDNDDVYQPVRAAVVQTLRRRGLNVTTTLRPLDSATQYREMSQTLKMAVYVEGELRGEGDRQSAVIHLRGGGSGQRISTARFKGATKKIVADINRTLWTRIGSTVTRSCTSVAHSKKQERAPLRIDAGEPLDSPLSANGT